MIFLILFLITVFLLAAGFAWLADQPGSLLVLKLGGFEFAEENLAIIAAIVFAILLLVIFLWIIIAMIWKSPGSIGGFFKNRRREKGWRAMAEGIIAVGAGDTGTARRSARNLAKYLPEEPVTQLLSAQSAQMDGKSDKARTAFEAMLEKPDTKVLGLRGLYIEAEATGESEAARHFVEEAVRTQPGLEWSGRALLNMQATEGDWNAALISLQQNTDSKLYTKKEAKRLRAVLLTAAAIELEHGGDPQKAKEKALEAHRLAPELVPAAVIAARVLSRIGDVRKATKIIETCWKITPHPDLMDNYTHLRSGDSGLDRLKRAESLNNMRAHHAEGIMGVTRAKMEIQDWKGARKTLNSLIKSAATERVCLLMSEIEEGEFGDRGRVREWLSRAVHAPRDPAWTADGYIADDWAPISPISGEIDAFEWRVPVENLNENEGLILEEIPSGPIELPIAAYVEETIKLTQAAAPIADNDTEDMEEDPATDSIKTDTDKNRVEEAIIVTDEISKDDVAEIIKITDKDSTVEIIEEKIIPETEIISPAPSEKTTNPQDHNTTTTIDPINKPPIDDPGLKNKNTDPARKRFKLF